MKKNKNLIKAAITQPNLFKSINNINIPQLNEKNNYQDFKVNILMLPTVFFKNLNNNSKLRPFNGIISDVGDIQYFPAWSKEWRNSVYHYNSNLVKNFPIYDINIAKLIKLYFNTYFNHQFLKYRHMLNRKRRLSFNKIFLLDRKLNILILKLL